MNPILVRIALAAAVAAPMALGLRAQAPASPAPQGAQTPNAAPPQDPNPAPSDAAQGAPSDSRAAQAEQVPTPTFRTDINFVRVDVIVSDNKGTPIADLRQEDFEVTEDGKPQAIQTFKLINIADTTTETTTQPPRQIRNVIEEQAEAARDDVRLFAVFLDDYHVRLENSMRAREPIARFIESQLQPADMAGIMYPLWPIGEVMLGRDRKSVAGAIRAFVGRKYDYTARNIFEERYVHYVSTIEAERIRNQVTLSAIKGLVYRLGGLREGRKAIILISEGFTNSLPPQVNDRIATCNGAPCYGQPRSRPDPIGQNSSPQQMRQDSADFFLQTELWSDLRSVTELANRYNTTIYAVDPRGLAPFEFDLSTQGAANVSLTKDRAMLENTLDTLRNLADETDGRAIVNSNDLASGLRQIVRDYSAYYLLGYTTQSALDGKFHEIKVRVKRPNVQVRARRGYVALTPSEAERALAPPKPGPPRAIVEALGTLGVPARRALIRSWMGMSPGTGGKTKITFVWGPTPPVPGARTETPAGVSTPVRVSLMAGNANSDLYYRQRALEPGRVEFEVPPGPIELEIAVENSAAEVLDRETRKIEVPSMGLGLTVNTPEVFRARTAREWQTLAADAAAVPITEREFRRTERLLVRAAAQSAGGTPTITARLLNREGGQMSVLQVMPAGFSDRTNIDVPLAALPAGEFLIEVKASDGAEETTALVAIRITG
jgi:VWFA-related protein